MTSCLKVSRSVGKKRCLHDSLAAAGKSDVGSSRPAWPRCRRRARQFRSWREQNPLRTLARAPSAMARATDSLTAPCSAISRGIHPEGRDLRFVRIGDVAGQKNRRGAGHIRQAMGQEPPCARFRHRQGCLLRGELTAQRPFPVSRRSWRRSNFASFARTIASACSSTPAIRSAADRLRPCARNSPVRAPRERAVPRRPLLRHRTRPSRRSDKLRQAKASSCANDPSKNRA